MVKGVDDFRGSLMNSIGFAMFHSRGSAKVWLLVVAMVVVLAVGIVAAASLLAPEPPPSPEPLPLPVADSEQPPVVYSIVVTDEEVLPLLPLEGARLHFMPGNKIQVGHKSVPFQPIINCGVSEGMLWFSGIPSWIDLSQVGQNVDNYLSRWTPAWSFTVDTSMTLATSTVTPGDGLFTANTTPTFDWADIADESGVRYSLEVDDNGDFSSPVVANSKLRSPSYTLTDEEALASGDYFWRVMQWGKLWVIGMPPWLDISRHDPKVTRLPTIVSVETGDGEAKISYIR